MIGTTISHYKILEKLGEGGMGVVYKAQDLKLNRLVALKFFPHNVRTSEPDKARFLQEAQAAAALSHPNICTIFGIEEHDGHTFIAMEYVEGQTLRDKGLNIPLKQSIEIGIQLADGLAAAHEKGVVHRDLKPENIIMRKDGRVQIMDFGLAKLKGASRLTKEGSTVGTAGYMSPEQVQGQETDHRTDIFSLGVVLYELIAGQSPFKAAHETAIAYEIVNVDPEPISSIKPDIDPQIDAIVLECLMKEPAERSQSVAEVAKDLRRVKKESSRTRMSRIIPADRISQIEGAEIPPPRSSSERAWMMIAVSSFVVFLAAIVLWGPWVSRQVSAQRSARLSIVTPVGMAISFGWSGELAISPDGSSIVFVAAPFHSGDRHLHSGNKQLYLRKLNDFASTVIPGTEGGECPFFSPDGQWVGFMSDNTLKKVALQGGAPITIFGPVEIRGASWGPNDKIVFTPSPAGGLWSVSSSGGTAEQVTLTDSVHGEINHRFADLLPGGKAVLFTVKPSTISSFDDAKIAVEHLDTKERRILIEGGTCARYVATGNIVYGRGSSLYAVPFDLDRLEVTGPSFKIIDGAMIERASGASNFSFSSTGTLVYAPGGPVPSERTVVAWVSRTGKIQQLIENPGAYVNIALSPGGDKLAFSILSANNDIEVYDIARKTHARLTFAGGNHLGPLWTVDGKRVVYSAEKGANGNLCWKPSDGSGNEEQLLTSPQTQFPDSWSPNGKILAFTQISEAGQSDIWILPMEGDRKPRPFVQTEFIEHNSAFSPDAHWLAYDSHESGDEEVYVVPYPKAPGKWLISSGGGGRPMWSRTGKELFYLNTKTRKMMSVEVTSQPSFRTTKPKELFELPERFLGISGISPDNQRFAIIMSAEHQPLVTELNVILGWFDELKKK